VILNQGKVYDVSVSAEGYTFLSTQFDLKQLETYQEYTKDIQLEPIKAGAKIVLNNIYFDVDSDVLMDVSKFELQRAIKLMKENPTMIVEISGHTDATASEEYNLDLSLRRSKSVVKYFVDNGVENGRLSAKGYGESQPIASNSTEEGRGKNRRVEFSILRIGK
jgi:outer membrane protein OmpA-like peptidoglycan-associated protein